MELRHLRYFVAVADDLHFGRAANRLHTSQSSLSQQIRNLETELKVDLLRRIKRRVELTPAGARFLGEARGILSAAERAAGLARGAAREESRKIVIGISPETDWAFLGKALRLFGEQAPSVEVLFQNLTPEAQIESLQGSAIDIGFVGLPIEAEGIVSGSSPRSPRRTPWRARRASRCATCPGRRTHCGRGTCRRFATISCSRSFGEPASGPRSRWKADCRRRRPFSEWSRRA
jgi:DNA-binding transcriptional LysR family regulator